MKTISDTVASRRRSAVLAAILSSSALIMPFGSVAMAQDAVAEEDDNAIVVTAQRRSEALEDVPMTVAVISQETMSSAGINTVRDLANVTSGFQLGNSGNTPQPSVRGITTTNAGAYENNVALFVDGLYQVTPQVLNMDLPNVQNIQILKGAQGTLYGRNATGGAILLDTIDPSEEWEGNIEGTYGRFNDRRARGYVAGPLAEGIGLSLAGTFRKTDGYYKIASRSTPGQFDGTGLGLEQESIRAKLKFGLSENLNATLGYSYARASDPRGVVFTPIENVGTSYTVAGRNTRPTNLGEVAGDIFKVDYKQHEGSFKLELDTGLGTLRSVTGYTFGANASFFDFNGSYVPDLASKSIVEDKTWQESLDLTINAVEGVDLIVGGTYYNIKTQFAPRQPNTTLFGPAFVTGTYPDPATTLVPVDSYAKSAETFFFRKKEAIAGFVDLTFRATDQLSVNVGGRYSHETQNVSGYKLNYSVTTGAVTSCPYSIGGESQGGVACGALVNGVFQNRASAKQSTYNKFTPRASLRYELTPGTNVYATYSRGFRSGEWNGVIPGDNPANWFDAKQETVDSFEVGFKTAGRRLRFELSGFYSKFKDLQVSNTQSVNGVPLVVLTNAPNARVYGAEVNVDYELIDNLNVRAGATWLNARYGDNFSTSAASVNPASVGFNVNSDPLKTFVNRVLDQNLSGLQMSRAPDFTGFFGFDYLVPDGDGGLRFAANVKYTTSYVVTNPAVWGGDTRTLIQRAGAPVDNTLSLAGTPYVSRASEQRARQGAHALVNASVTWTDPSDSYYVRLWGNNLSDVKVRSHYNPLAPGGTYAPIGDPRTFGGTIGFKFRGGGNSEPLAVAPPPPPPPAPPPPPPPPPVVAVCNKGPYIVFFDWDKSDITAEAAGILDSAVSAYGSCASVPVMLAGYADRSGKPGYNQGLSERRNTAVRGYLGGRGIPDGAISSQGFGENNNRVATADGVRELQNRRVEITYGPGSGN